LVVKVVVWVRLPPFSNGRSSKRLPPKKALVEKGSWWRGPKKLENGSAWRRVNDVVIFKIFLPKIGVFDSK
jgi:hypothetical protein